MGSVQAVPWNRQEIISCVVFVQFTPVLNGCIMMHLGEVFVSLVLWAGFQSLLFYS